MDATPGATSPWHEGEIALQKSVGAVEKMYDVGRKFVRPFLLDQHREFYAQLPFLVIGSVDPAGNAWASILHGEEGFISTPDTKHILVSARRDPHDPASAGMQEGAGIGALGIDLDTRRRNRINGRIERSGVEDFVISVTQSYGNCPQYIRQRELENSERAMVRDFRLEQFTALNAEHAAIIGGSDTFFVATYHRNATGQLDVDASHRGGKPGFVRVNVDGTLTIPDFSGNLFFNTLGNIALNGKAGLLFVDFDRGDLLQISGTASVDLTSEEIVGFHGAERLWHFRPKEVVLRKGALALRWRPLANGSSPNSLVTGDWESAAARVEASRLARQWRPFKIDKIVDHTDKIRSLYLTPADGGSLAPFEAGQFLPIRVHPTVGTRGLIRTYSLSLPPSDDTYRITVKADGVASRYLQSLAVGTLLEARAPDGAFRVDARATGPAVFVAAGVGVTPIIAMLGHLAFEGFRTRRLRNAFVFHAAHSKAGLLFADEFKALVEEGGGAFTVVRFLTDVTDAAAGIDFDRKGRLNLEVLKEMLPAPDECDFYLCGPPSLMREMYEGLLSMNVADSRIFSESFGAAAIARSPGLAVASRAQSANGPVTVSFAKSGTEATWEPVSGTLLDLAESNGLEPEFSCRRGTCGTCRTTLFNGEVAYPSPPIARTDPGEVLICCAVPSASAQGTSETIRLDL